MQYLVYARSSIVGNVQMQSSIISIGVSDTTGTRLPYGYPSFRGFLFPCVLSIHWTTTYPFSLSLIHPHTFTTISELVSVTGVCSQFPIVFDGPVALSILDQWMQAASPNAAGGLWSRDFKSSRKYVQARQTLTGTLWQLSC